MDHYSNYDFAQISTLLFFHKMKKKYKDNLENITYRINLENLILRNKIKYLRKNCVEFMSFLMPQHMEKETLV